MKGGLTEPKKMYLQTRKRKSAKLFSITSDLPLALLPSVSFLGCFLNVHLNSLIILNNRNAMSFSTSDAVILIRQPVGTVYTAKGKVREQSVFRFGCHLRKSPAHNSVCWVINLDEKTRGKLSFNPAEKCHLRHPEPPVPSFHRGKGATNSIFWNAQMIGWH